MLSRANVAIINSKQIRRISLKTGKWLNIVLAIFLLNSISFAQIIHHYDHTEEHHSDDCQVMLVVKQAQSFIETSPSHSVHFFLVSEPKVTLEKYDTLSQTIEFHRARSPPLV